ncbi:hypothetical protein CGCSCA5_v004620 [Colletotrichum siamense]|nr:hypothetical protein CGCSCA5_v004620 [Colletotrichum siamense]
MRLALCLVPFLVLATKACNSRLSRQSRDWDQCYYAKGAVAPPELLPCLNETDSEASEASWCCFAGHLCLENQACWDPNTTNTYQYGCNDPEYEHGSCPHKGGLNMSKLSFLNLSLERCDSMAEENSFWGCNHPDTCGENCPRDPESPTATLSLWPWTMIPLPALLNRCEDMATLVLAAFAPTMIPSKGYLPEYATSIERKPTPTRVPAKTTVSRAISVSVWTSNSSLSSKAPVETVKTEDAGWTAGAIAGTVVGTVLSAVAIVTGTLLLRRRQQRRHGL